MPPKRSLVAAAVAVALVSGYVNLFLNRSQAAVRRDPISSFPKTVSGFESTDQRFPNSILENLGVDDYLVRRYTDGKEVIWLYIGYYRNQKEGSVPHSPRNCYPGSGFTPLRRDVVAIKVATPNLREIRANRYVFAKGQDREVVIYWYQSRGRAIANEYMEKVCLITDAIFRNRSDGALVRFSMRASAATEKSAMKRLEDFVSAAYPAIPRVVPD
ncbi:MAG: EpsI family protein [Deltaproteobacteria bacterium]|nr:EpsI family protein [Deltaproteobacteria bacterium]